MWWRGQKNTIEESVTEAIAEYKERYDEYPTFIIVAPEISKKTRICGLRTIADSYITNVNDYCLSHEKI